MSERILGVIPSYLQPTATLINATLVEGKDFLDLVAAGRYYSPTPIQTAFRELLPTLIYDAKSTTALALQATLEPFTKVFTGLRSEDAFRAFVGDLEYVDLLEKGGLEGVNTRLSELVNVLKTDATSEEKLRVVRSLNRHLYRAIHFMPHLATGVEVKLAPGTEDKAEEFGSKYSLEAEGQRRIYDSLRKAYPAKLGKQFPEKLILPLPYGFTTGTHGSGERSGVAQSSGQIGFGFMRQREGEDALEPVVNVSIQAAFFTPRQTNFTLDEVESVRFVGAEEYTPVVAERDGVVEFRDRGNPVSYYLYFRDFSNNRSLRKRENLRELSDEEWEFCQTRILSSRPYTNLWRDDYRLAVGNVLIHGFMAVKGDMAEDVTLYELTDLRLPKSDIQDSEASIMAKILREGVNQNWLQTFKGRDVITRLMTLPVAERDM